jgi:hypothetical protein
MLRWVAAFFVIAITAVCLGLLEPVLAASDTERLFLLLPVLMLVRSPIWVTSFVVNGRTGLAS